MKIGFAATYGYKTVLDAIKFAEASGFNAVELSLNMQEFYPENYNAGYRAEIKKIASDKNILLTFHAPEDINLCSKQKSLVDTSIDILKKNIEFAYDLGGTRFTFHIGDSVNFTMFDGSMRMEDYYASDYMTIMDDAIGKLCRLAGGDLQLCAENTGYFSNAKIDCIKPRLGNGLYLTWDLGHAFLKKVQMDFMMDNIDFVRNVHIHDVIDKKDHCIIGTGQVNIPKYISMMDHEAVTFIIEVRPGSAAVESFVNLKGMLK